MCVQPVCNLCKLRCEAPVGRCKRRFNATDFGRPKTLPILSLLRAAGAGYAGGAAPTRWPPPMTATTDSSRQLSFDCHIGHPLSDRRLTPSHLSCAHETPFFPPPCTHRYCSSAAWLADARRLRRSRRWRWRRECRCRQRGAWRADDRRPDACRLRRHKRTRPDWPTCQGGAS